MLSSNQDSNKELQSSSKKLVDLGDFRFCGGIRVYNSNVVSKSVDPSFVEVHETYHLHMCSSTPFGVFQSFLGFIVSSDDIQHSVKSSYSKALNATKENSWVTHEGVATTCELLVCLTQSRETASRAFAVLPPQYKKACLPLCRIISKITLPLVVAPPLVEAIGYTAFGTSILRDMGNHSVFAETDWKRYFMDTDRNPDSRFAILLEALSSKKARNRICDSVVGAFNNLNLPSESAEFTDCYRNLTLEKQKECDDSVRKAVIHSLYPNISFTVEDEDNIVSLYRVMERSWFSELGISNVQHNFVEHPNPCDIEDQLRMYLDQIDYVPPKNQDMYPEGIFFIHSSKCAFTHNMKNYGNPFYAKLLYNGSTEDIGSPDNPLRVPIDGGILYLHAAKRNAERFHFTCPIDHGHPKHTNATCAVKFLPGELINLYDKLSKIDCVMCLDEGVYRWSPDHMKLFLKEYNGPIVVIPTSSQLSSWCNTIKDLLGSGHVLGHYGIGDAVENPLQHFCLMSSQNGHFILVRPTSKMVYSRILRNSDFVQSYADWDELSKQFSPAWSLKLRLACNHYMEFGW